MVPPLTHLTRLLISSQPTPVSNVKDKPSYQGSGTKRGTIEVKSIISRYVEPNKKGERLISRTLDGQGLKWTSKSTKINTDRMGHRTLLSVRGLVEKSE